METNKLIAEWLGWKRQDIKGVPHWVSPDGLNAYPRHLPVRFDSDAAAVTLLPELVKRGYEYELASAAVGHVCTIIAEDGDHFMSGSPTIAAAICSAICAAITRMREEEEMIWQSR